MELNIVNSFLSGAFEVHVAEWNNFNIELIRKTGGTNTIFLPSKVTQNGLTYWGFKTHHPSYHGIARLEVLEEEYILTLSTREFLDTVIPIKDLPHLQQTHDGDFIGGRNIKHVIKMKRLLARRLCLQPRWTKREEAMLEALAKHSTEKHIAEQRAEKERQQAAQEAALRAREEKRAEILRRRKLVVYTQTGHRHFGYPVVEKEWECLPNDTFCILVKSFDRDSGKVGEPISSFVTTLKESGKMGYTRLVPVFAENPTAPAKAKLPELKTKIIKIKDEPQEVVVAESIEQVHVLRDNGLNSGTLVMTPEKSDGAHWTVYRLANGKIETVTRLRRIGV